MCTRLSESHKATICCILVSHQEVPLKFMRAGGHYLYTQYHYLPTTKKFSSWTHEATLPVKEVKSGGKRFGILGSETSFSCFAVH